MKVFFEIANFQSFIVKISHFLFEFSMKNYEIHDRAARSRRPSPGTRPTSCIHVRNLTQPLASVATTKNSSKNMLGDKQVIYLGLGKYEPHFPRPRTSLHSAPPPLRSVTLRSTTLRSGSAECRNLVPALVVVWEPTLLILEIFKNSKNGHLCFFFGF